MMRRDQVATLAWASALAGIAAEAFKRSLAQGALANVNITNANRLANYDLDARDAWIQFGSAIPEIHWLEAVAGMCLPIAGALALLAVLSARGGRVAAVLLAVLAAACLWFEPEEWLARGVMGLAGLPTDGGPPGISYTVSSDLLQAVSESLPTAVLVFLMALPLVPMAMLAWEAVRPRTA